MKINFKKSLFLYNKLHEENPLVDIKNVGYIHATYKTSKSCDENPPKYIGKGMIDSMLPYLQQDDYDIKVSKHLLKVITLENKYLKATILPTLGGRLYSLIDKENNKELLYKNDSIQFCNLSLLNAWFAGGVEWNVSIKGHNPLTCSKLFASKILVGEDEGIRLYEYERKRNVCYSIDFILPENSKFLIVIPRIENNENKEKYNYWWSNIAVKQDKNTRVIVPATKSYVSSYNRNAYFVDYINIPKIDGVDTSYPFNAKCSNDYFYDIPENEQKWICAIQEDGSGLIELSTNKLIGRKMFVWGNSTGGNNWQDLLSNKQGKYVEIQAGLAKTQLEHIPMAANSKWEWVEAYGNISINKNDAFNLDYNVAINAIKEKINESFENGINDTLEKYLDKEVRTLEIISYGSGWGAFNSLVRNKNVSNYLEFPNNSIGKLQKPFVELIKKGYMKEANPKKCPRSYEISNYILEKLLNASKVKPNWNTYYQLATTYYGLNDEDNALKYWLLSYETKKNAWAARNIAMYYKNINRDTSKAYKYIMEAYELSKDKYIIKDVLSTLNDIEMYDKTLEIFNSLSKKYQKHGRFLFYYANALNKLDRNEEASKIINYDFMMHDIREGEISISDLWYNIYGSLLLENFKELSFDEIMKKIDQIKPLNNLDFRMHK